MSALLGRKLGNRALYGESVFRRGAFVTRRVQLAPVLRNGSKPIPQSAVGSHGRAGLYGVGAGLVASSVYYHLRVKPLLEEADAEILAIDHEPVPPPPFEHPLDSESWAYRTWFKAKRLLFLAIVFAPVACASILMKLSDGNPEWRQYFLDCMVTALSSAGCTFQKFGQWVSMRPDMFPPDVIQALSTLQAGSPAHKIEHTRRMIKESFGVELEELFEEFDEEPVASGTVGQVHRARLKAKAGQERGDEVAVKVRHPHVLESSWMDIDLIYEFVDNTDFMAFPFDKDEFLRNVQKQINFEWEAYNLKRFARNFKQEIKEGKMKFPQVVSDLCTHSVMVETWLPGKTGEHIFSQVGMFFKECKDVPGKFTSAIQKKKKALAETVFDMSIKMFLRDNLIHGDLHGGNILYNQEDDSCAVLDVGLTTSLDPDIRPRFNQFLRDLVTCQVDDVIDHCLAFQSSRTERLSEQQEIKIKADIERVVRTYVSSSCKAPDGGPVQLGDCCGQLFFTFQNHGLQLRGDVASSIMTLSLSEGLIRSLDPTFDIVRSSLPYFSRFGVGEPLS